MQKRKVTCRACLGTGHFAKTCTNTAALRVRFALPPGKRRIRAPAPRADVEHHGAGKGHGLATCAVCQRPGHRKPKCPQVAADVPVPDDAVPPAPIPVRPGARFTVAEDFTEHETGARWRADETWEAVAPAGSSGGVEAWRLRRLADGAEAVGHPALHPFVEALPGGPSLARDWRVGMREAPEAAAA